MLALAVGTAKRKKPRTHKSPSTGSGNIGQCASTLILDTPYHKKTVLCSREPRTEGVTSRYQEGSPELGKTAIGPTGAEQEGRKPLAVSSSLP